MMLPTISRTGPPISSRSTIMKSLKTRYPLAIVLPLFCALLIPAVAQGQQKKMFDAFRIVSETRSGQTGFRVLPPAAQAPEDDQKRLKPGDTYEIKLLFFNSKGKKFETFFDKKFPIALASRSGGAPDEFRAGQVVAFVDDYPRRSSIPGNLTVYGPRIFEESSIDLGLDMKSVQVDQSRQSIFDQVFSTVKDRVKEIRPFSGFLDNIFSS